MEKNTLEHQENIEKLQKEHDVQLEVEPHIHACKHTHTHTHTQELSNMFVCCGYSSSGSLWAVTGLEGFILGVSVSH